MAQPTIRDVARRAAVSVASVSRALNGHENVRAELRERVRAAADALGYVPHAGARSLSLARAHAIGVVLPDLHGEFFSEIVRGMDREASEHGLQLLLSNFHSNVDQAAQALRAMRGRVDGLLIMAPHLDPESLLPALPASCPAVLINSPGGDAEHPALRIDNAAGAAAMVEHLVASGRRHIVHIAGPDGNVDASERAAGFAAAMARHAPGVEPRVLPGDFSEESGEAAARAILTGPEPVDAVFAANDMMAIGCLQTLAAADRGPPVMAVGGFDDIPVARYLHLTTVRVRIAEMGARAVARLIARLDGDDADAAVEMHQPELVVRATTTSGGA